LRQRRRQYERLLSQTLSPSEWVGLEPRAASSTFAIEGGRPLGEFPLVAHALLTLETRQLVLVDVDAARAGDLAQALCARFGAGRALALQDPAAAIAGADGLVNATPVGMAKFPGLPLPTELLSPHLWVADIVYFPLQTQLLAEATARGCRTISGAGMAVFQAAGAFRLFSGVEPDANRMLAHFAELTQRSPI